MIQRIKIATILSLIIAIFACSSIFASTWQVFNVASGLPSSNVTSFSHYSKWLAVGTDAGLAIYNGEDSRWEMPLLQEGIASLSVKDLAFDEDGGLWVANSRGLIRIFDGIARIYSVADGLPNNDVDRIQMLRGSIVVGCFGGYIAHAALSAGNKITFHPVNFEEDINLKISSVGISALCFSNSFNGYYGSLGNGLGKITGKSEFLLKNSDGLLDDWINDMWEFTGKEKETRHIVLSPEGLSFLKNGNVENAFAPLKEKPWFNSIITIQNPSYVYDALPEGENCDDQNTFLKNFLEKRSLYLGTRDMGIWRFQKGNWQNYNSGNSSLPSNQINRLYVYDRFIVAATGGGLVLIPVDSFQNDEFKYCAIGTPYSKTIYSPPPILQPCVQYFQILRNKDYWFVHEKGVSRFKTRGFLKNITDQKEDTEAENISSNARSENSSLEAMKREIDFSGLFSSENKKSDEEWRWQLFSTETFDDKDALVYPIYSEKVTKAVADRANQCLWIIFNEKHLCRMWIKKKLNRKIDKVVEVPEWEFILDDSPWARSTILTTVWLNDGKLYVGTDGDGFYFLENPDSIDRKTNPFRWQHFGSKDGLRTNTVLGFSRWNSAGKDYLAILHPRSVSTWDGSFFGSVEMGGKERYTCIAGDQVGNLWVGSQQGLFRITPEGSGKEYTAFNSEFESNNITAIAIPPINTNRTCGIWVACDEEAKLEDDGRIWGGLDEMPMAVRLPMTEQEKASLGSNAAYPANKLKLVEQAIDGGSLHFFNGTVWEKWNYAGINSIMIENEFIWLTSNLRVRRIRLSR